MSSDLDRLNRRFAAVMKNVREVVQPALVKGAEEIAAWGIRFTGGALWLRTSGGRLQEMRWLGGRRAIWPEQGLDVRATGPSDEFTVRVTPSGHEVTRSGDGRVAVAWLGEPLA